MDESIKKENLWWKYFSDKTRSLNEVPTVCKKIISADIKGKSWCKVIRNKRAGGYCILIKSIFLIKSRPNFKTSNTSLWMGHSRKNPNRGGWGYGISRDIKDVACGSSRV